MTDRSIDKQMLITQEKKTRNLELGGGLESGDGGHYVIGIEEQAEQVSAKNGRTHCGRPHEARKLVVRNRKKNDAGRNRSTSYSRSKFDLTKSKSWKHLP